MVEDEEAAAAAATAAVAAVKIDSEREKERDKCGSIGPRRKRHIGIIKEQKRGGPQV